MCRIIALLRKRSGRPRGVFGKRGIQKRTGCKSTPQKKKTAEIIGNRGGGERFRQKTRPSCVRWGGNSEKKVWERNKT